VVVPGQVRASPLGVLVRSSLDLCVYDVTLPRGLHPWCGIRRGPPGGNMAIDAREHALLEAPLPRPLSWSESGGSGGELQVVVGSTQSRCLNVSDGSVCPEELQVSV